MPLELKVSLSCLVVSGIVVSVRRSSVVVIEVKSGLVSEIYEAKNYVKEIEGREKKLLIPLGSVFDVTDVVEYESVTSPEPEP